MFKINHDDPISTAAAALTFAGALRRISRRRCAAPRGRLGHPISPLSMSACQV
jgi:hypothetical protein